MRARTRWLALVLLLIIFQGFVYQQFLVLTESGLRVIFASGTMSERKILPRLQSRPILIRSLYH